MTQQATWNEHYACYYLEPGLAVAKLPLPLVCIPLACEGILDVLQLCCL
jgi:hypothetical protein